MVMTRVQSLLSEISSAHPHNHYIKNVELIDHKSISIEVDLVTDRGVFNGIVCKSVFEKSSIPDNLQIKELFIKELERVESESDDIPIDELLITKKSDSYVPC